MDSNIAIQDQCAAWDECGHTNEPIPSWDTGSNGQELFQFTFDKEVDIVKAIVFTTNEDDFGTNPEIMVWNSVQDAWKPFLSTNLLGGLEIQYLKEGSQLTQYPLFPEVKLESFRLRPKSNPAVAITAESNIVSASPDETVASRWTAIHHRNGYFRIASSEMQGSWLSHGDNIANDNDDATIRQTTIQLSDKALKNSHFRALWEGSYCRLEPRHAPGWHLAVTENGDIRLRDNTHDNSLWSFEAAPPEPQVQGTLVGEKDVRSSGDYRDDTLVKYRSDVRVEAGKIVTVKYKYNVGYCAYDTLANAGGDTYAHFKVLIGKDDVPGLESARHGVLVDDFPSEWECGGNPARYSMPIVLRSQTLTQAMSGDLEIKFVNQYRSINLILDSIKVG